MISIIEQQPVGSGHDLIKQVEEIFSPTGILSRAKNFEFRPQQQEMAVAVARALQNREHLAVEAGTGVGKSLAYLIPAILFAVARKEKGRRLHAHHQFAGAAYEKDLPMLAQILPVKVQFAMLKGRGNYLCTRRLQKAMQQGGNLFTSSEGRGTAAHLRMVENHHATAACRISTWSRTRRCGRRSAPSTALCSPKKCGFPSDFAKDNPRLLFSARARANPLLRRAGAEPHAVFHAARRRWTRRRRAASCSKTISSIFDEAHRWSTSRRGTSA